MVPTPCPNCSAANLTACSYEHRIQPSMFLPVISPSLSDPPTSPTTTTATATATTTNPTRCPLCRSRSLSPGEGSLFENGPPLLPQTSPLTAQGKFTLPPPPAPLRAVSPRPISSPLSSASVSTMGYEADESALNSGNTSGGDGDGDSDDDGEDEASLVRGERKDKDKEKEKEKEKEVVVVAIAEVVAVAVAEESAAAAATSSVAPAHQMGGIREVIQVGGEFCEVGHYRYEYESFPAYPERRVCCFCEASP